LVDQRGQNLRQDVGSGALVHTQLASNLAHCVATQHVAQYIAGNGLILSGTNPGVHSITHAGLLEL
jgi:hypothetical protein